MPHAIIPQITAIRLNHRNRVVMRETSGNIHSSILRLSTCPELHWDPQCSTRKDGVSTRGSFISAAS